MPPVAFGRVRPFDIAVVGAGPAGSVAAYRLASAGVRTLLVDKASFPRDKPCGGGVTGRAARLLPFSIEPVVEDVVDRIECRLHYGPRFERRARAPLAYMTQRKRLDHFLLQKAAEAGADVRDGVKVADVRADALTVDGEEIAGAHRDRRRRLQRHDRARSRARRGDRPRRRARGKLPARARFAHAMVLELAVVRGGYGWVFPKGDHINVGVGGDESEGPRLREHLRRLCESTESTRQRRRTRAATACRCGGRRAALARGTAAVIGDAAGLVDPFSGDGMYEAFLSAQLVAEAALDVLAGRAEGSSRTQQAVARRITPLTAAGWGAKVAFDRFPRTTFALARLPITFRAVEKLLQGELGHPGAARGFEKAAIGLIYAVARRAGDPGRRSTRSAKENPRSRRSLG